MIKSTNTGTKQKGTCERSVSMISNRNSPTLRTTTRHTQQQEDAKTANVAQTQAAAASAGLSKVIRSPESKKASGSGWVPIVFDDDQNAKVLSKAVQGKEIFGVPRKQKTKLEEVPIEVANMIIETTDFKGGEEGEKSNVDGVFSDYIDHAGSSFGGQKPIKRRDSFHDRVSNYINRAKLKFLTMPSFVKDGNAASVVEQSSDGKQRSLG